MLITLLVTGAVYIRPVRETISRGTRPAISIVTKYYEPPSKAPSGLKGL